MSDARWLSIFMPGQWLICALTFYAVALSMVDQVAKPLARPVRVSMNIFQYHADLLKFQDFFK